MEKSKNSLIDWRFRLGIFLLILAVIILVISLSLFGSAKFINKFNNYDGNGFWALNHYGVKDLLFNWVELDDQAIMQAYLSHQFLQVFVAIIFLLFLLPVFFILAISLIIRWWVKTRI